MDPWGHPYVYVAARHASERLRPDCPTARTASPAAAAKTLTSATGEARWNSGSRHLKAGAASSPACSRRGRRGRRAPPARAAGPADHLARAHPAAASAAAHAATAAGDLQPGTGVAARCRSVAGRGDRGAGREEGTSGSHSVLERVLGRLYEGQTLGAALAEHPQSFPPLYVATVRASERTGALREALTRYIAYQQQVDVLRKTLVNASIYPAVLLGAGLLVTLFLHGLRRAALQLHLRGPRGGSAVRLAPADAVGPVARCACGLMVVLLLGALGGAAYGLTRPAARERMGAWVARIPAIGRQLHIYQLARLYRTVGMLLRGGMPAVTALNMSAGLLRASARSAFAAATQAVREGRSLARCDGVAMASPRRWRRACCGSGERSGNMGEMMERIAAVLRRGAGALGRGRHPPDRAAADDGDRPHHRRHRRAHVLPDLRAGREHPLSAAPQNLTALALLAAEKRADGRASAGGGGHCPRHGAGRRQRGICLRAARARVGLSRR